jgi:hypothetical protein
MGKMECTHCRRLRSEQATRGAPNESPSMALSQEVGERDRPPGSREEEWRGGMTYADSVCKSEKGMVPPCGRMCSCSAVLVF